MNAPSLCAQQYVRQYFQDGTLPEEGTVCEPLVKKPFLVETSLSEGNAVSAREDGQLLATVQAAAGKIIPSFKLLL